MRREDAVVIVANDGMKIVYGVDFDEINSATVGMLAAKAEFHAHSH